ncbi:MAG: sulfite exporter TauE/SafE family protein [Jatrophihabitantaceae bacterium]
MHLDYALALAGALVGLLVGLTGMGGGALLTPVLVLFFNVPPLAAISSDLVTSLVMKPVGAAVHLRRRTVQTGLLTWLALGSVPSAFVGSLIIGKIGHSSQVQSNLKLAIGIALLASLSCTVVRQVIDRRSVGERAARAFVVKPVRTVAIGVIGGVAVGMTSVGAGSLVIALLLLAYPRLSPKQLVGTDIVQAIPLVAAAAFGHLLFGEVRLSVTTSLLIGAIPAVYLGARLSSQAPSTVTRPIISGVLMGSSLALLHAPTPVIVAGSLIAVTVLIVLGRPRQVPSIDAATFAPELAEVPRP